MVLSMMTVFRDGEPKGTVCRKRKPPRLMGKYIHKKSGHCKHGGWCCEEISRFNDLYKLVHEDRACPQAATIARKFLAFCRDQGGGVGCADRDEDFLV